MLRYLDNAQSVGPESLFAERAERRLQKQGKNRRTGLNENLAREILELHTLGVDGGYRQDDVVELARAITGWGCRCRANSTARCLRPRSNSKPRRTSPARARCSAGATRKAASSRAA
jgi:uncharacterized protein (DUF1800 family)